MLEGEQWFNNRLPEKNTKFKEIYYSQVGVEVHTSWGHVGRSKPGRVKTERARAWGTYLY